VGVEAERGLFNCRWFAGYAGMMRYTAMVLVIAVGVGMAHAGTVETLDGKRYEGELRLEEGGLLSIGWGKEAAKVALAKVRRATFKADPAAQKAVDLTSRRSQVNITTESGVALKQLATDAVNGNPGVYRRWDGRDGDDDKKGRPYLTDAKSLAEPGDQPGWFSGTVTWDLGGGVPAWARQLDKFSIWIWAGDPARSDYSGSLSISVDGEHFTEVPGTRTDVDFREAKGKTYNRVVYRLVSGQVTNFRYLRLNVYKPPTCEETRIVETDADVSRAPMDEARRTSIVTRAGSEIVGSLRRADATSLVIQRGGEDMSVPTGQIARVLFYRFSPESLKGIGSGRKGALLQSGDYLEGDLKGIDGSMVSISSVLFGVKRLEGHRQVMAVMLRDVDASAARYEVRTEDGSTLVGDAVGVEKNGLWVDEPVVGKVKVRAWELVEIGVAAGR